MSDLFSAAFKNTFGTESGSFDPFSVAKGMNQLDLFRLLYEKQKMENERYGQLTPMELDIKGLEAARARQSSTPEMLKWKRDEDIGTAQTKIAEGKTAEATQQSNADYLNSQNKNKSQAAKEEEFFRSAELFNAYGGNPFMARANGVDPSIIPDLSRMHQDGSLENFIERYKTNKADSVGHRQATELKDIEGGWHALQARITAKGHTDAASITGDKSITSQILQYQNNVTQHIGQLESNIQKYTKELAAMDNNPLLRSTITSSLEYKQQPTTEAKQKYLDAQLAKAKSGTAAAQEVDRLKDELSKARELRSQIGVDFLDKINKGKSKTATTTTQPPSGGKSNKDKLKDLGL